ncbi:hypothetical protein CR513_54137, partial [Mucuna pruriens]
MTIEERRKVVDQHTCSREFRVKLLSTKWLSGKLQIMNYIREKAQKKWNVGITKSKALRAMNVAKNMVDGSFKEQYKRIYDYSDELLRLNLRSTMKIKVEASLDDESDI